MNVGDGITSGTLTENHYLLVQGNYAGGVFTVASGGNDTLLLFDGSSSGVQEAFIVLVGINGMEATASHDDTLLHSLLF